MSQRKVMNLKEFADQLDKLLQDGCAAHSLEYISQNQHEIVTEIDAIFTNACRLQSTMTTCTSQTTELSQGDEHIELALVHYIYSQICKMLNLIQLQGEDGRVVKRCNNFFDKHGLLNATRLSPYLQLFTVKEHQSTSLLISNVSNLYNLSLCQVIIDVHSSCIQYFSHMHDSVMRMKSWSQTDQLIWLQHLYGATLSLYALSMHKFASDKLMNMSLTGRSKMQHTMRKAKNTVYSERRLTSIINRGSIFYSLVRCYEFDLPQVVKQLGECQGAKRPNTQMRQCIACIRYKLLQILEQLLKSFNVSEMLSHSDLLLKALSDIAHLCDLDGAEKGSYVSDFFEALEFQNVIVSLLGKSEDDVMQGNKIEMLRKSLPKRPSNGHSPDGENASAERIKNIIPDALIQSVKDLFADLGEGFIMLILDYNNCDLERTVNLLLEGCIPSSLQNVSRSLQNDDPAFLTLYHQSDYHLEGDKVTKVEAGNSAGAAFGTWIGKNDQISRYDPRLTYVDAALAAKTIALNEEQEVLNAYHGSQDYMNEYNDDYDDEYEESEQQKLLFEQEHPESLDEIISNNRRMRNQEKEDEYWKSIKNPNYSSAEEIEENELDTVAEESHIDTMSASIVRTAGSHSLNTDTSSRARAHSTKTKSKLASHQRKHRAVKKREI